MFRRSLVFAAIIFALAGAAVGATLALRPGAAPRDVVLVARGMSFFVEGDASPNPTIRVRAGEHVRFVLRNEAPGLEHDLAIPALGVALEPLAAGESRSLSVRIPAAAGTHPYLCRPHARMMRGTLTINDR